MADNFRGHPLADFTFRLGHERQSPVRMSFDIDKARCDDLARSINGFRHTGRNISPYLDNTAILNGNICTDWFCPRAINDNSITNND